MMFDTLTIDLSSLTVDTSAFMSSRATAAWTGKRDAIFDCDKMRTSKSARWGSIVEMYGHLQGCAKPADAWAAAVGAARTEAVPDGDASREFFPVEMGKLSMLWRIAARRAWLEAGLDC